MSCNHFQREKTPHPRQCWQNQVIFKEKTVSSGSVLIFLIHKEKKSILIARATRQASEWCDAGYFLRESGWLNGRSLMDPVSEESRAETQGRRGVIDL